jgi:hypothetical protein
LNSRLLLPPSTITDPGTVGPTERMSKPRMLYSPPRNSRSKMGSVDVSPIALMYSAAARNPNDVRDVCRLKTMPSRRGL